MIIWHRRGCHGTTPRHRSRNIANSTFSEGWLQERLRICRFADSASHPPCKKHCKYNAFMQNAAKRRFWDHTMGGGEGGGVVANREPGCLYLHIQHKRFWSDSGFVGETIGRVRNLTNQSMADPNRPRVEGTALWEPSEEEFFCPKESGWCMKISRTLHGYPDGFVLLWWLMI